LATRQDWGRGLAVVGILGALTVLFTYPLCVHPRSMALPLSADTRLFIWTISWDVHAGFTRPLHLFDANIFYPERRTLAYSEHLLGSAIMVSPLVALGERLLALNALVLLSCVLSGLGAYLLAREVGAGPWGSLIAGVIFAFAPPRFSRLGQIHLACIEWIPFCLAGLHAYARRGAGKGLVLAALAFTAQALTSGHGGLFLSLAAGLLLVYLWGVGGLPSLGRMGRDLGVLGALVLLANVPFLLPYFAVRSEVGLHRTLGAVEDWTPNLVSYLAAPTYMGRALLGARLETAKAFLFPGLVTLVLAGASLVRRSAPAPPVERARPAWRLLVPELLALVCGVAALWIRSAGEVETSLWGVDLRARSPLRAALLALVFVAVRVALSPRRPPETAPVLRDLLARLGGFARNRMGTPGGFYLLLALVSLWASLGPPFWLYTLLYRTIPGFDLIRVPSRLTLLTILALAVLAALGFDRLVPDRKPILATLVLVACVGEFLAPVGARPYSIPAPRLDRSLVDLPEGAPIVELPVVDPGDAVASARLHSYYLLHSLAHFHPMVNGYSGFVPPRSEELFRLLATFPDEASLHALEGLSVRYAVVHKELYPPEAWARAESRLGSFGGRLKLLRTEDEDRLYELTGVP
jgi:hypothetical protein